ncbi:MAG: hypothetical protein KDH88_20660 [Chromatiales bacterium]|nr:hypothetical protein [Chromatiales bacterium]
MKTSRPAAEIPAVHPRWGAFAEELLHHTSRYYAHTEAFLRHRGAAKGFSLAGYQADRLSTTQRKLMVVLLCHPPTQAACADIARLVETAKAGNGNLPVPLARRYQSQLDRLEQEPHGCLETGPHEPHLPPGTHPLDPFLALADRLNMPVQVIESRVEVSLTVLAEHLDSPLSQQRTRLQEAILWLHEAGYRLHNHPHLTHDEAQQDRPADS